MARGFKHTFHRISRGVKQVVSAARRGVKHIPAAIRKTDKFITDASKVMDTAGEYARLAGKDFGSDRATQLGNRLQERAQSMRQMQQGSELANRLRSDFR